jgi:hypothetical protein
MYTSSLRAVISATLPLSFDRLSLHSIAGLPSTDTPFGFDVLVIDAPFCAALFICGFFDQKEAEPSSAEATPSADVRENIDGPENVESMTVSIDW